MCSVCHTGYSELGNELPTFTGMDAGQPATLELYQAWEDHAMDAAESGSIPNAVAYMEEALKLVPGIRRGGCFLKIFQECAADNPSGCAEGGRAFAATAMRQLQGCPSAEMPPKPKALPKAPGGPSFMMAGLGARPEL